MIRTLAGKSHGLTNSGTEPFIHLTATTPPIDLRVFYRIAATQEEGV